ncbi:hypothetical protein ACFE04_010670 [Oxalis oulophora]
MNSTMTNNNERVHEASRKRQSTADHLEIESESQGLQYLSNCTLSTDNEGSPFTKLTLGLVPQPPSLASAPPSANLTKSLLQQNEWFKVESELPPIEQIVVAPAKKKRARKNPNPEGIIVPPPYPWATDKVAKVHTLSYLRAKRITRIKGTVHCKKCERQYEIEFDLIDKIRHIFDYIAANKDLLCHRAPKEWKNPDDLDCKLCLQQKCVKPIFPNEKENINWLFLLLGQLLGFCTLAQLKYFCQWTGNHRTGAKDRVLYLTYLGLCKQLQPDGPFSP